LRLKELAGVILATSTLVASVTGLVTAVKARADVRTAEARQDDNAIHTAVQEGNEDLALRAKLEELRERLAALEAAGGRR
jgi:hypothetical protein